MHISFFYTIFVSSKENKYVEDINNDIDKKYQFYLSICNIENPMTRNEFIDAVREGRTYAFPTKKEGVLRYYKAGDLK